MIDKNISLRDGTRHGRIINGCWQFSQGHSDNTEMPAQVLQKYIESWFPIFDGADIYTWVEEVFWKVFDANREVIGLRFHTKHVPDLDDVISGNISREKTISQIMRSCSKMKTGVLQNVQFHWWDYAQSWYEISLNALLGLQSEWIIEHIWVTNCNVTFLKKLEKELWPLENRSLRKYLRVIDDWGDWKLFQVLLQVLSQIWDKYEVSISEVSIAWILHQKWLSSAIVWVRNTKYLNSLDRVLNIDLTKEDLAMIDKVYFKWQSLEWDVFDLERNEPRHRDIMKFNLNKDD